jgi:putative PIN family toxin of toxin-antitoxin system
MGMRVILDTSVIVSGLRSRDGASWAVLEEMRRGQFRLTASPALFLEYEEVLKREEHGLWADQVENFLSELATLIEPVQIRTTWRPQMIDADDEMVLDAAINGHVDAIVTHNRRDFEAASRRFGIAVWSPAELLLNLRRKGAD